MILGFDIEIWKAFPDTGKWIDVAPLGVTCAALSDTRGKVGMLWYSAPGSGTMTKDACTAMLKHIERLQSKGHQIITWNGLGFDWHALAHETQLWEAASRIALKAYDPMYALYKLRGFPVGLGNAAVGCGFQGKLEGVTGQDAVKLWREPLQRPRVLEYVVRDAQLAAQIGKLIETTGQLSWRKGSGEIGSQRMKFKSTEHFVELPMPDQSWMDKPIPQEQFTGWLKS